MDPNAFLLSFGMSQKVWDAPGNLPSNRFGKAFAIAKMEIGNDIAQATIDAAHGHRNLERFRKRFLLMGWNKTR